MSEQSPDIVEDSQIIAQPKIVQSLSPVLQKFNQASNQEEDFKKDFSTINFEPKSVLRKKKIFVHSKKSSRFEDNINVARSPALKQRNKRKSAFFIAKAVKTASNKILAIYRRKRVLESGKPISAIPFNMINDKAASLEEGKQRLSSFFGRFLSKSRKKFSSVFDIIVRLLLRVNWIKVKGLRKFSKMAEKKVPTISSTNPLKVLWDVIIAACCFISILWFSVQKFFILDESPSETIVRLQFWLLLLIYIDIGLNINTSYYKDGSLITERYMIVRRYIRGTAFCDLIPCLCLSVYHFSINDPELYNLCPVLVLKLFKVGALADRLKQLLIHSDKSETCYKLFLLFLGLFLWVHLIACLWHYLGTASTGFETNWISVKNIVQADWQKRYLFSFYWGVTTVLTVGYGDIVPTNQAEMIFVTWAMLLGCCMFGYTMNSIGEILKLAGRRSRLLKDQMNRVDAMMQGKNLPGETQIKVKKYLEFVWDQEQKEDPEYEKSIMSRLSSTLRDEINYYTYVKLLKTVPCFDIFSDKTLIQLSNHMHKVRFSPEEFVVKVSAVCSRKEISVYLKFSKADEFEEPCLFFVMHGNLRSVSEMRLIKAGSFVTLKKFKKGEYVGIHELISGFSRGLSVISQDFSTLFQLARKDFLAVIKRNEEEYEKFCLLRDKQIVSMELTDYKIKCEACGLSDHETHRCHSLNYCPNPLIVIGRYIHRKKKLFRAFKRRRQEKSSSLAATKKYQEALNIFHNMYEEDDDFNRICGIYIDGNEDNEEHGDGGKEVGFGETVLALEKVKIESPSNKRGIVHPSPHHNHRHFNIKAESKIFSPLLEERAQKKGNLINKDSESFKREDENYKRSAFFVNHEGSHHHIQAHRTNEVPQQLFAFDKIKSYKHYYPRHNVESVVGKYNSTRVAGGRKRKNTIN